MRRALDAFDSRDLLACEAAVPGAVPTGCAYLIRGHDSLPPGAKRARDCRFGDGTRNISIGVEKWPDGTRLCRFSIVVGDGALQRSRPHHAVQLSGHEPVQTEC